MESDPNQMSQSPTLCRSGCGFYGNAAFDGMCSMCYKESVKRKQAAPTATPTSLVNEALSTFRSASPPPTNSAITPTQVPVEEMTGATSPSPSSSNAASVMPSACPAPSTSVSVPALANAADESASTIVAEALSTVVTNNYDNTQSDSPAPASKPAKKKKVRCELCRANVGVISFPCRCGLIFCGSHRYAKEHNCTFDYKEHGAEEIRKNNPQIIGEKIQKI